MSRIAVAGVIIASTAIGGGVAVNMGVLDTLDSADKNTRITTTHVDLATFTARTVMGNERRGQIPEKSSSNRPDSARRRLSAVRHRTCARPSSVIFTATQFRSSVTTLLN